MTREGQTHVCPFFVFLGALLGPAILKAMRRTFVTLCALPLLLSGAACKRSSTKPSTDRYLDSGYALLIQAPERALAEYRTLAANNGALRAEALWGVAESAARLGDRDAELSALTQLLRDYPNSAYAPVARSRMAHVTP